VSKNKATGYLSVAASDATGSAGSVAVWHAIQLGFAWRLTIAFED